MNSARSISTNSDHDAIVHSRPDSRCTLSINKNFYSNFRAITVQSRRYGPTNNDRNVKGFDFCRLIDGFLIFLETEMHFLFVKRLNFEYTRKTR